MSSFGEMVAELECPTCGGALRALAPGHRLRCAAFYASRRRRSIVAALVLLFVVLVAFVALPAAAQSLDPAQLTDSFNTKALATIAAVELVAIAFLARALMNSYEARIAAMSAAHEATLRVQVAASELAKQALESIDIVEHVVRRAKE